MMLASVLVLSACAGAAPTGASTTASNKLAAQRDAKKLLRLGVLPTGATRVTAEPAGDGGLLREPASEPGLSDVVDRHAVWRVAAPLDSVVAFVEAHRPSGSRQLGAGSAGGPGAPRNREIGFSFPAVSGQIGARWLTFRVVALPHGSTGVRVDAQDVWIVTRSPSERVPAGVHEIDIRSAYPGRAPVVSLSLTDRAKVRQIVRWIDALGIIQPGLAYACPALSGPTVTFDFRADTGVLLAQASVLDFEGTSGPCNPIEFTMGGHHQTPLIDGDFLKRVQRLLGVSFTPAR